MKTIILFTIYIGSFILFYLLLSLIGCILGYNYFYIISQTGWLITYGILIGWLLAIFPAREYWLKHEDYFNKVF